MATSGTDAYISKYTPLSAAVFIGIPGIDEPPRRKKPKTLDPSKKSPVSPSGKKPKGRALMLMTTLHNPVPASQQASSDTSSDKRPSSSRSSKSEKANSPASPISGGSSLITRGLLRKHHSHPNPGANPPLPIIREGFKSETSPSDDTRGGTGPAVQDSSASASTSRSPVTETKPEIPQDKPKAKRARTRDATLRTGPYVQKNGRRYHTFALDKVPYPRSYDDEVIEHDNLTHIFLHEHRQGLSWHHFLTPPKRILDLGCGDGHWVISAAQTWADTCDIIIGLDILPIQRTLSVTTHKRLASKIRWVHANFLERLPFASGYFDFVHAHRIGRAVPEDKWEGLVQEVKRVLAPEGVFEMTEEDLLFPFGSITDPAMLDEDGEVQGEYAKLEQAYIGMHAERGIDLAPSDILGPILRDHFGAVTICPSLVVSYDHPSLTTSSTGTTTSSSDSTSEIRIDMPRPSAVPRVEYEKTSLAYCRDEDDTPLSSPATFTFPHTYTTEPTSIAGGSRNAPVPFPSMARARGRYDSVQTIGILGKEDWHFPPPPALPSGRGNRPSPNHRNSVSTISSNILLGKDDWHFSITGNGEGEEEEEEVDPRSVRRRAFEAEISVYSNYSSSSQSTIPAPISPSGLSPLILEEKKAVLENVVLHLSQGVGEVMACTEPIWDWLCTQQPPPTKEGDEKQGGVDRAEFDQWVATYQNDMQLRIAAAKALHEQLEWHLRDDTIRDYLLADKRSSSSSGSTRSSGGGSGGSAGGSTRRPSLATLNSVTSNSPGLLSPIDAPYGHHPNHNSILSSGSSGGGSSGPNSRRPSIATTTGLLSPTDTPYQSFSNGSKWSPVSPTLPELSFSPSTVTNSPVTPPHHQHRHGHASDSHRSTGKSTIGVPTGDWRTAVDRLIEQLDLAEITKSTSSTPIPQPSSTTSVSTATAAPTTPSIPLQTTRRFQAFVAYNH
ncbi:hypothetical protein CPB86DRAFT_787490 [Serendipita vermifera]|nr:hypothetical protein CPB86DRAFT_787490 [Serendipita vermifera]